MELKYIEDRSKLNEVSCRLIRNIIIWLLSYVILVMCDLNVYLKWIIGVGIYIMFWADTFRTLIPNIYIFLFFQLSHYLMAVNTSIDFCGVFNIHN